MASYIPHVKYAKGKVRLTNHWIKHILFSYLDKYTFNNDLQVQGLSMELVGSMGLLAEMRWCRRELAPGSAHGSLPFLSLPAPGSILYYTSHGSKLVMAQPTWNALCVCKPRRGPALGLELESHHGPHLSTRTDPRKRPTQNSDLAQVY